MRATAPADFWLLCYEQLLRQTMITTIPMTLYVINSRAVIIVFQLVPHLRQVTRGALVLKLLPHFGHRTFLAI